MTLVNRLVVEGTSNPTIHVGHKSFRTKTGVPSCTKTYYAEWSLGGKQHRKSLKTTNKKVAINQAHALHDKICLGDSLEAPKEFTVDEAVTLYLNTCRARTLAPKTIEKYELTLNNFKAFCTDRSLSYLGRFGQVEFWEYVKTMERLSNKTKYDRMVIVQQLFKWSCEQAEIIQRNPIRRLKLKKPSPKKQPCYTPEQVRKMIDTANEYLRPMIVFLSYTGCRFGEMRDLLWEDVHFEAGEHGVLDIRHGGSSGETKGRKSRRIPIHAELRPYLDSMPRIDDRVFHSHPSNRFPRGNGRLVDGRFLDQVKALCKLCGFPNPHQYKTHTFRHAFASMLARQNVSYRYALQLMGHGSSKILDLYFSVYDADAVKAIQAIQLPPSEHHAD